MLKVRILALSRLLRLSLAPSALADAAAGLVLAGGLWPSGSTPWLLLAASACIYHGGMVLNDWSDRVEDARVRPARPIPSGGVSVTWALSLGCMLLALGIWCGFLADPMAGRALALVALAAVTYDLAGRGPLLGPSLLALCRAGNLGAGIILGLHLVDPELTWTEMLATPTLLIPPGLYGSYVFLVSRLGRLEDRSLDTEERRLPPRLLRWIALVMVFCGLALPFVRPLSNQETDPLPLLPWSALCLTVAVTLLGARAVWRSASQNVAWENGHILSAMGLCLRRLLVLSCTVALAAGTWDGLMVSGCILLGYPLSFWLRRAFPPS